MPPIPSDAGLISTPQTAVLAGVRIPILMYHRIAAPVLIGPYRSLTVDPALFAQQMDAIAASGAATLTMSQVVEAAIHRTSFPQGAVAITFDDALEDQYAIAFPILERDHIRATFYVPTSRVGHPGILTWTQIRQMYRSGLIEFGAHSETHRDLTTLTRAQAWKEIAGSRSILEATLKTAVTSFAYPFGKRNSDIETLALLAGFTSAVTTAYGWTHPIETALHWGRIEVHESNAAEYLAELARASGDLHEVTVTLGPRWRRTG